MEEEHAGKKKTLSAWFYEQIHCFRVNGKLVRKRTDGKQ